MKTILVQNTSIIVASKWPARESQPILLKKPVRIPTLQVLETNAQLYRHE